LLLVVAVAACAAPPPAPAPFIAPALPLAGLNDRRPPDVTARLTEAQRRAIAAAGQRCWAAGPAAQGGPASVELTATYDVAGAVRAVLVEGSDRDQLSDTRFRAFAERAMAAVRDPRCARLPLPTTEIGRPGRVTFRFRP
jgi:hypothetical protein